MSFDFGIRFSSTCDKPLLRELGTLSPDTAQTERRERILPSGFKN